MDPRSILRTKRDGGELSAAQIDEFLEGYVAGRITDEQATALVAAIFFHGMGDAELEHWTRAMLGSGDRLDLRGMGKPVVDKHSTGGVGDKVSLPLAPALAACGCAVPMISGRGLGHTGGTLDKLESIAGLRTGLSLDELKDTVRECGFAFGAQTAELVPADGKLYALRDRTGLVESLPLIASSILSKKLAEDLDALVLDVKFGSGAFLTDPRQGRALAETMVRLAAAHGVSCSAWQTAMDRPLGRAVGHALEVAESLACLEGGGPADLRELVLLLGGDLLVQVQLAPTLEEGRARIARALDSGAARELFARAAVRQGARPTSLDELPRAPDVEVVPAPAAGVLVFRDVRLVGLAACALGGGRLSARDEIDPAVGIVWRAEAGEELAAGAPLCELHHRAGRGLDEAREHLMRALAFVAPEERGELPPLVLARVPE